MQCLIAEPCGKLAGRRGLAPRSSVQLLTVTKRSDDTFQRQLQQSSPRRLFCPQWANAPCSPWERLHVSPALCPDAICTDTMLGRVIWEPGQRAREPQEGPREVPLGAPVRQQPGECNSHPAATLPGPLPAWSWGSMGLVRVHAGTALHLLQTPQEGSSGIQRTGPSLLPRTYFRWAGPEQSTSSTVGLGGPGLRS